MINKFLRKLRDKKAISAGELAKQLGYSRGYISLVETGRIVPSREMLRKYSDFFNLSLADDLPVELADLIKEREKDANLKEVTAGEDKMLGSKLPEELTRKVVNLNINVPNDLRILYSDVVSLSSSEFGEVLDFGQRLGGTNQVTIVARLGLSRKHARALMKLLQDKLKEANTNE